MSGPVSARRLSAYCALYTAEPDTTPAEIHDLCRGPHEVRLKPVPPATVGALLLAAVLIRRRWT